MEFDFERLDVYQKDIQLVGNMSGRWHINEKKKFFWIARGSVYEVVSVLTVIWRDIPLTAQQYDQIRQDLGSLAMMISKLAKSMDRISR